MRENKVSSLYCKWEGWCSTTHQISVVAERGAAVDTPTSPVVPLASGDLQLLVPTIIKSTAIKLET